MSFKYGAEYLSQTVASDAMGRIYSDLCLNVTSNDHVYNVIPSLRWPMFRKVRLDKDVSPYTDRSCGESGPSPQIIKATCNLPQAADNQGGYVIVISYKSHPGISLSWCSSRANRLYINFFWRRRCTCTPPGRTILRYNPNSERCHFECRHTDEHDWIS